MEHVAWIYRDFNEMCDVDILKYIHRVETIDQAQLCFKLTRQEVIIRHVKVLPSGGSGEFGSIVCLSLIHI